MTPVELSTKNKQAVADLLNRLLADEFVLYTQTLNAHWNIISPNFLELHKFFEEQYESLAAIADEIAERVRTIGHFAAGSLKDFQKLARIGERLELSEQKIAIGTLLAAHESVARNMRRDIETIAEKYADRATADFMSGILAKHEKMAWMLRASL